MSKLKMNKDYVTMTGLSHKMFRRGADGEDEPGEWDIRHAAVGLANFLCCGIGGTNKGDETFEFVTQGRQRQWKREDGTLGTYSSCEDLPACVYQCLLGGYTSAAAMPDFLNRSPNWDPGQNLLAIKMHAPGHWKTLRGGRHWRDIEVGDAIQVQGLTGPHTLMLLSTDEDERTGTVTWTTADYGQVFGRGHGARVYEALSVKELDGSGVLGVWSNGQRVHRPIIGYVDTVGLIREHWSGVLPLLPDSYVALT